MSKIERFIIYPLFVGLLVLFAFFDLNISETLFNPLSHFGRIFSTIGDGLFQSLGVFACVLLFRFRSKSDRGINIGMGIVTLFGAFIFAFYGGANVYISLGNEFIFGGIGNITKLALALIAMTVYFVLGGSLALVVKVKNPDRVLTFALFTLIIYILSFVLSFFLEVLWSRPSFRFILQSNKIHYPLPTSESDAIHSLYEDAKGDFRPIYFLYPFYFLKSKTGVINDFMSAPSSNVMKALGFLVFGVIPLNGDGEKKLENISIRLFAYIWALLVGLAEIRTGASFATDIALSFLLEFLFIDLMATFFYPWLYSRAGPRSVEYSGLDSEKE